MARRVLRRRCRCGAPKAVFAALCRGCEAYDKLLAELGSQLADEVEREMGRSRDQA